MCAQTDRQTDRNTDRQTDSQTNIQTDRQTDKQTYIHTYRFSGYPESVTYSKSTQIDIVLRYSHIASPIWTPLTADIVFKFLAHTLL
jgi:hypothetical protein